jgi:hypothetical protein
MDGAEGIDFARAPVFWTTRKGPIGLRKLESGDRKRQKIIRKYRYLIDNIAIFWLANEATI